MPKFSKNNFFFYLSRHYSFFSQKYMSKFMFSVGFQAPKSGRFFRKSTAEQVLKSFSGRNNSLEPLFLDFLIVFHMVWKNQES